MCRSLHIHLSSGHYHYVRNILMSIRDAHTVKWIITGRTFYFVFQKLSEGLGKGDENLDSEVVLKFLKVWKFCFDALICICWYVNLNTCIKIHAFPFYLKLLLKRWATELNERPVEEKRSFKGKLASAQHSQTVTYMKPLLRKLKKRVCISKSMLAITFKTENQIDRVLPSLKIYFGSSYVL